LAKLVATAGPHRGSEFELTRRTTTIGRSEECDIVLEDESVSRQHARITLTENHFHIEDLNSTNGTFVNGKRIISHQLLDQDRIQICKSIFIFYPKEAPKEEKPSTDLINILPTQGIDTTTILGSIDASTFTIAHDTRALVSAGQLKQVQRRLQIVNDLSLAIAETLSVNDVLEKILNDLFLVFPQAERGFIMLREGASEELVPKAVKYRHPEKGDRISVSSTIINEAILHRRSVLSADALEDDRFRRQVSVADYEIHSVMCVPLIYKERILGIIHIDTTQPDAHFSKDDLSLLTGIATQAAMGLASAKMHEALLKRQRLERDLQIAMRIQRQFLPRSSPRLPGYSFVSHYTPAFEIGGDFFDFIRLGENLIGIVIGDVSGKGISAALMMARLTSDIRFFASRLIKPARVLKELNDVFYRELSEHGFVTLIFACLDTRAHTLLIGNAGHLPALLVRDGEGVTRKINRTVGFPLGVMDNSTYDEEQVHLNIGESIVFYTDGLIEAMNREKKLYTLERVETILRKVPAHPETMMSAILEDVQSFVKDAPQSDDLTLITFGRPPERR